MKEKIYKEIGFIGAVVALLIFFGGKSYFYEFWNGINFNKSNQNISYPAKNSEGQTGTIQHDTIIIKQEIPQRTPTSVVYVYPTNDANNEDSNLDEDLPNNSTISPIKIEGNKTVENSNVDESIAKKQDDNSGYSRYEKLLSESAKMASKYENKTNPTIATNNNKPATDFDWNNKLTERAMGKGNGCISFWCANPSISIQFGNDNNKNNLIYSKIFDQCYHHPYIYHAKLPPGEYKFNVYLGRFIVGSNLKAEVKLGEYTEVDLSQFTSGFGK